MTWPFVTSVPSTECASVPTSGGGGSSVGWLSGGLAALVRRAVATGELDEKKLQSVGTAAVTIVRVNCVCRGQYRSRHPDVFPPGQKKLMDPESPQGKHRKFKVLSSFRTSKKCSRAWAVELGMLYTRTP
eukprot:gene14257-biopygen11139